VLVADGDAVVREVALQMLSRLGCLVSLLDDGRRAAEAVATEAYDLVMSDDPEAAVEIRRAESAAGSAKTPIVALTASGRDTERWREAGIDGTLAKPFTLAALAAKVAEFVAPVAAANVQPIPKPQPRAMTATLSPGVASDLLDPQVTSELARMAAAGKGDFVARVRRLYRDNAPAAVKALIAASTQRDCAAAARAANALKSMSLNMGARLVAETAARLEVQARDLGVVNVDQAQILHRQLLATLDVLEGYPPDIRPPLAADAAPDEEALLADLAKAIDQDELTLVYQPQFDREGVAITGIETLVRWTHPTRGFVSPAFFIPIAERYGLIGRVTQWVLGRAMRETKDLGDFTIGFNASAVEFADPSFVDELAVLIARCGFDPKRLEIEVTETAVLAEEDEVRRNMARLHDLGLKIALDDFGVGYSSLSHLRLFPFDKLKIDRAFVTGCAENVQSATLVHAVVSIGRALGMKVVAEGVETEEQRKFLKVAGVHAMQGYLFAKPEPVGALRDRIAALRAAATPTRSAPAEVDPSPAEEERRVSVG
jgi:EAL domain-containing protein (putative c-di-GMP-specific phosphodiesterase class I)/CheY-like chemotaxis protein